MQKMQSENFRKLIKIIRGDPYVKNFSRPKNFPVPRISPQLISPWNGEFPSSPFNWQGGSYFPAKWRFPRGTGISLWGGDRTLIDTTRLFVTSNCSKSMLIIHKKKIINRTT